jgi:hypothetical protein
MANRVWDECVSCGHRLLPTSMGKGTCVCGADVRGEGATRRYLDGVHVKEVTFDHVTGEVIGQPFGRGRPKKWARPESGEFFKRWEAAVTQLGLCAPHMTAERRKFWRGQLFEVSNGILSGGAR